MLNPVVEIANRMGLRSWDEKRVVEWLRGIGCQKYDSIFESRFKT
jgi:hypothetical protein